MPVADILASQTQELMSFDGSEEFLIEKYLAWDAEPVFAVYEDDEYPSMSELNWHWPTDQIYELAPEDLLLLGSFLEEDGLDSPLPPDFWVDA